MCRALVATALTVKLSEVARAPSSALTVTNSLVLVVFVGDQSARSVSAWAFVAMLASLELTVCSELT